MSKNKTYSVLSLFTGCGGMDLGFKGGFEYLGKKYPKHRFDISWANDINIPSCETFTKNFHHEVVPGDIRILLKEDQVPRQADIVIGGFPCQDFSLAGKRRGFNSKRGLLYQAMVEVVRRSNPYIFVAENVKGLLSMNGGDAIRTIEKDFKALGYTISTHLYFAADYGVPQSRERVMIVGTSNAKGLPVFEHPGGKFSKESWITLDRAIGDLADKPEGAMPNHFWSKAKMFPGTQGNSFVSANNIGPTMRAEHHGNIEWHWNKKRRLSAREAARIQSFPDNFIFYPSTSEAYRQIGNAVAPVLAWNISDAIQKFLDNNLKQI